MTENSGPFFRFNEKQVAPGGLGAAACWFASGFDLGGWGTFWTVCAYILTVLWLLNVGIAVGARAEAERRD